MTSAETWIPVIGSVTTLLGGLGGYWLAGRNEEGRDRRAAKREEASRRAAIVERLEEQRHSFQRDTLLELQDELQHLARVTIKILLWDKKTLKEQGAFFLLPEGLSDEAYQITVSVRRLQSRVLDSELRQSVARFSEQCAGVSAALGKRDSQAAEDSIKEVDQRSTRVADAYNGLSELLGVKLRCELDRQFAPAEDITQMLKDYRRTTDSDGLLR